MFWASYRNMTFLLYFLPVCPLPLVRVSEMRGSHSLVVGQILIVGEKRRDQNSLPSALGCRRESSLPCPLLSAAEFSPVLLPRWLKK